jgi:hypothetical protein
MRAKRQKLFLRKLLFFLNDFAENILRRKLFYVETKGALILYFPLKTVKDKSFAKI